MLPLIQFNNLSRYKSLVHFSTTIQGGVSSGNYSSLNLGYFSGDAITNVTENRQQLTDALNITTDDLYTPHQTHEDKICVLDEAFLTRTGEERLASLNGIDALITNQKNIAIGISTADCVPILIYDPLNHALAAVHAGWRGTVARIAQKVIGKMAGSYGSSPATLVAAIGPAISRQHFEVGNEVSEQFTLEKFPMEEIACRSSLTAKIHIDLKLANKYLLTESGVAPQNIEIPGLCTYSQPGLFFSARRQSIKSGRMLTGGLLT